MSPATQDRAPGKIVAFLAGLQGGLLGILFMLAWLGLSASWLRRSFWSPENLLATAFYGDAALKPGFTFSTLSGTSLYLLTYCLLGGLFALIFRRQARQARVLLLSLAFSMSWYYVSFHVLYRSVLPLVYLLHAERPMVLGHLVYGTFLARFQNYTGMAPVAVAPEPEAQAQAEELPVSEPAPETVPQEPALAETEPESDRNTEDCG